MTAEELFAAGSPGNADARHAHVRRCLDIDLRISDVHDIFSAYLHGLQALFKHVRERLSPIVFTDSNCKIKPPREVLLGQDLHGRIDLVGYDSQTAAGATNYGGKLQSAQTRYENAVAAEADAYAELNGNPDFQNSLTALNAAKEKLASAELNYRLANDTILQSLGSLISELSLLSSDEEMSAAPAECVTLLNDVIYALNNARSALSAADGSPASADTAYAKIVEAENDLQIFKTSSKDFLEAHPDLLFGFEQLTPYFDNTKAYFVGGAPGGSLLDCVDDLMEAIERSNSAQTQYDAFSGMFSEQYNAAVAERQAAEAALKALRESADDYNRQAALTGLSLQDLKYQIERAQEKLDSLTGGSQNQITAKVSGTVSSVAVTAGKTVAKDEVLATIEVPDMGYTLSFSVTTDQARRLHPGDSASVTSYYWGSRIEATLSAIKPDPKNPQTNRLLEFDVTGDVSAGAQLTVSIGERSQNYDFVVPNSAIRSDSNGKFIFVIQAKNSPLGNRYFAKRVDVEILAADDNNSAVTGGINYGDYVITTSSAPLKNGDQVRMAEG